MKTIVTLATILCICLTACEPERGATIHGDNQRDSNTFSIGKRTGVMVKLSRKGTWHKPSFEGQMLIGGVSEKHVEGGIVAIPNTWDFSISDYDVQVAKDVEKAIIAGCRVVAVYQQLVHQTDQWADTTYRLKAVLLIVNGELQYFSGEPYKENAQGLPEGTAKPEAE